MAVTARRRATYQDLLEVPENRIAEIIDGRLEVQPRPAPKHALAASLGGELVPSFQGGRGGPGGSHLWLLDPDQRTLEVFGLQQEGRWLLLVTFAGDDPVAAPPFAVVTFSFNSLWGG